MPTLEEVCIVKKGNKAKKDKSFEPFNSLTAALAKKQAMRDIKAAKNSKKK